MSPTTSNTAAVQTSNTTYATQPDEGHIVSELTTDVPDQSGKYEGDHAHLAGTTDDDDSWKMYELPEDDSDRSDENEDEYAHHAGALEDGYSARHNEIKTKSGKPRPRQNKAKALALELSEDRTEKAALRSRLVNPDEKTLGQLSTSETDPITR